MSKVYLLDTMFFIFRSFYALPVKLTNAQGQQTGAVLGVYKALQHLVRTENVTHCIAAFESPWPRWPGAFLLPDTRLSSSATIKIWRRF